MQVDLVAQPQYESLVDLLSELHSYYNNGAVVDSAMVKAHLLENLLGADSPLRLVVACNDDDQVLGFAAISLTYSLVEPSPAQRRQCQLKELYIRSTQRGHGVGKAIMLWVAHYAVVNGRSRIDWSVKASNVNGIRFYEALGAQQVADRLSYRLAEPNLGKLLNR
ncbi:N-acetyltransferase family protein [Ampullimonas aquatilis]|uniref:GNAT family N-acetyltransferase n=1 Tax=Ampullimonas aquatilis TaxID=1341549 RepID=UPI003C7242BE